jgi:uncharacterized protein YcnI
MNSTSRASSRALKSVVIVAATMCALGTAPASAHVRVDADDPAPGSYAVLTFKVPNESEKGSLTTKLTVALPDVTSASTEVMPGWSAQLDRDVAAGTVRSVSWTAAPGTGIGADQFGLFRLSVKLPDTATVSLPATQTYADGTIVKWDQPTTPGGEEPEYPSPELALTGPPATATTDTSSRWLAGGALAVAALALVTALLRRRQS